MSEGAVIALALLALGTGAAIAYARSKSGRSIPKPPPHAWKSDSVTPPALGPRNRVSERVGRLSVLTQAVLLACEMARADDSVEQGEMDAIKQFLVDNVPEADEAFAKRVMREGFETVPTSTAVDSAIETIRAVGSEEQRRLVLQLLVHVAQADDEIHADELAFMQKVGNRLGLDNEAVKDLIYAGT